MGKTVAQARALTVAGLEYYLTLTDDTR